MRYASKKDTNHNEIADAFRSAYWSVLELHRVGGGCGDLLVSRDRWTTIMVEVKRDKKAKYTKDQIWFRQWWKGRILRVETMEDVAEIVDRYGKIKIAF